MATVENLQNVAVFWCISYCWRTHQCLHAECLKAISGARCRHITSQSDIFKVENAIQRSAVCFRCHGQESPFVGWEKRRIYPIGETWGRCSFVLDCLRFQPGGLSFSNSYLGALKVVISQHQIVAFLEQAKTSWQCLSCQFIVNILTFMVHMIKLL